MFILRTQNAPWVGRTTELAVAWGLQCKLRESDKLLIMEEARIVRSEKPKGQKTVKNAAGLKVSTTKEPILTLFTPAGSGSTALNYLAQDPEFAEREAAVMFEACRDSNK